MNEFFISNLWFAAQLPLCLIINFFLWRFFANYGLFTFVILTTIIANIQVLKTVQIYLFPHPIALGTIIFCTSFLAIDMIVELYGAKNAFKALLLSFFSMIFFFIMMHITIKIQPTLATQLHPYTDNIHLSMKSIFSPSLRIALSSLIAFFVSQTVDIIFYYLIRRKAKFNSALSSFFSSSIASIIDNCLFILLAFKIFAYNSISYTQLFYTYALSIAIFRVVIAAINGYILNLWLRNFRK